MGKMRRKARYSRRNIVAGLANRLRQPLFLKVSFTVTFARKTGGIQLAPIQRHRDYLRDPGIVSDRIWDLPDRTMQAIGNTENA
jgi:hypothetical protein